MTTVSKRMKAMAQKATGSQLLPVDRAVTLLKEFNTTKFDQTVEIAVRLGVDPEQADQIVRGAIVLPHGIGKSLRVVVFAKGDKIDEAAPPEPMRWAVRSWRRRSKVGGLTLTFALLHRI